MFRVWLICQNHVWDVRIWVSYFLTEFGLSKLEIVLQREGSGGELVLVLDIRVFCLSVFRLASAAVLSCPASHGFSRHDAFILRSSSFVLFSHLVWSDQGRSCDDPLPDLGKITWCRLSPIVHRISGDQIRGDQLITFRPVDRISGDQIKGHHMITRCKVD